MGTGVAKEHCGICTDVEMVANGTRLLVDESMGLDVY
jgi:hypothetical protein